LPLFPSSKAPELRVPHLLAELESGNIPAQAPGQALSLGRWVLPSGASCVQSELRIGYRIDSTGEQDAAFYFPAAAGRPGRLKMSQPS